MENQAEDSLVGHLLQKEGGREGGREAGLPRWEGGREGGQEGRSGIRTYLGFLGPAGKTQDERCKDEVDAGVGGVVIAVGGGGALAQINSRTTCIVEMMYVSLPLSLPPSLPPFGLLTYIFTSIDRKLDSSSTCKRFEQAPMMS